MIPSNATVCLVVFGVVFVGLLGIALLSYLIHFVCDKIINHLNALPPKNSSYSSTPSNSKN